MKRLVCVCLAVLVAGACDGGEDTTGQGGAASSGSAIAGASVSTAATGGSAPDHNDTIETATPLHPKSDGTMYGQGALDPPDKDVDYWSFEAAEGPILLFVDAQPPTNGILAGYIETVLSLYDADGKLLAGNDDPFPLLSGDPQLYTVLPKAGVYFLKLEEYCKTAVGFESLCTHAYFESLHGRDYSVFAVPFDPEASGDGFVHELEPNDAADDATALEYVPKPVYTGYFATVLFGDLVPGDVDYFDVDIPLDVVPQPGTRKMIGFDVQPAGPGVPPPELPGNGSSQEVGRVELLNAEEEVVARLDFTGELPHPYTWPQLLVPLPEAGPNQYYLRVQPGNATAGSLGPFYFIVQSFGGGAVDGPNPKETEEESNDAPLTPEFLLVSNREAFIEGDLADGDVDHFELTVVDQVFLFVCDAQRVGSGVRELTATVLRGSDGTAMRTVPLPGAYDAGGRVETGAETTVVVRMEKGSQDPEVAGVYYRCGFFLRSHQEL